MSQKGTQTFLKKYIWYIVALIGILVAAPNGTIIRVIVDDIDPIWANLLRFSVIAVVLLPFVLRARNRFTKKAFVYTLLAGLSYAAATVSYVLAIQMSQASYVATIELSIPILLMVYSVLITKERVTKRSFTGITIAALGAFAIVALPALSSGNNETFGLAPTLLAVLNCATFPLTVILSKKASDEGVSIWAVFGVMSIVVLVCNGVGVVAGQIGPPSLDMIVTPQMLSLVLYSAIGVTLLARVASIEAYKHIGSATVSVLAYVESFLAITLPILLLGELFTREMAIGGMLILLGVIIIETHFHPRLHHHRKHMPRSH